MGERATIDQDYLYDIADAIREKKGVTTRFIPAEMKPAILSIPTGGITPTGTVNIAQNGTHDVTQYASANVNVPNSYVAGDEGKVVSNGALVAQTSRTVTENGTYDTTENDEVVVNVSGGGSTLITKTITQNGTYNASADNADGYSQVVVDVHGGGSNLIEEWDYTGATPRIGIIRQCSDYAINDISFGAAGASFTSASSYIRYNRLFFNGCTIEIDVGAMSLSSGTHRRFIMAGSDSGLIYRSNGKWSFYGTSGGWAADTDITDGSYFANSTVKIEIDTNGYWHIYRNGILIYEPNRICNLNAYDMFIGAASTGIYDTIITGLRVY